MNVRSEPQFPSLQTEGDYLLDPVIVRMSKIKMTCKQHRCQLLHEHQLLSVVLLNIYIWGVIYSFLNSPTQMNQKKSCHYVTKYHSR